MSLPHLDPVKAIFFDLDDTLCAYWDASKIGLRTTFDELRPAGVSTATLIEAWAKCFRSFAPNLKKTGWFPTYLKTAEPSRTELMRLTLVEVGIDDSDLASRMSNRYMQLRDQNLGLFPDAIAVLDAFRSRFFLGLITNGPADLQRLEIATLGIESYFSLILIEGELDHGKPHELPFRLARESAGCAPNELLMVGNSYSHDIRPAIGFGWQTAWIRRASDVPPSFAGESVRPEDRPEDSPIPTLEISTLSELLPLVREIN